MALRAPLIAFCLVLTSARSKDLDGQDRLQNRDDAVLLQKPGGTLPMRVDSKFPIKIGGEESLTAMAETAWATMANHDTHVMNALVEFSSLRETNTTGDLVLLLFGDQARELHKTFSPVFAELKVRVVFVDEPVKASDIMGEGYRVIMTKAHKFWDFVKLYALALTQYHKVVFMDSDLLFRKNVDELFDSADGTHSDGPISPFNSGLVVTKPSLDTFRDLLSFVIEGDFSYDSFWRHKHGGPGKVYPKFHASETTQGLFMYYYHFYRTLGNATITLPRDTYNYQATEPAPPGVKVVHWTSCGKTNTAASWKRCPSFRKEYAVLEERVQQLQKLPALSDELLAKQVLTLNIPPVAELVREARARAQARLEGAWDAMTPLSWDFGPSNDAGQWRNRMLVWPERKFAFCYIDKNACTQFNRLLNELTGKGTGWFKSSYGAAHVAFEEISRNKGWRLATFLRSPEERFLSAYNSKCVKHEDGGAHCIGGDKKLTKVEDFEYVALKVLPKYMADLKEKGSINAHYDPQHKFCGGLDLKNFDFVGHLSADYEAVHKQIAGMLQNVVEVEKNHSIWEALPNIFPQNHAAGHTSGAHADMKAYYRSPAVRQAVVDAYADDYAMLHLEKPTWSFLQDESSATNANKEEEDKLGSKLFVGIKSAPLSKYSERRQANRDNCVQKYKGANVSYAYFIGSPLSQHHDLFGHNQGGRATQEETQAETMLLEEKSRYGDMQFLIMKDEYGSLPEKTLQMLKYAYDAEYEYVALIDDDFCLDVSKTLEHIRMHERKSRSELYAGGYRWKGTEYESQKGPDQTVAPYYGGNGYMLSRGLLKKIIADNFDRSLLMATYGTASEDADVGKWVQQAEQAGVLVETDTFPIISAVHPKPKIHPSTIDHDIRQDY